MRPRSSSTASGTAMIAWSTLAARICPSERLDEVERTKAVRRGSSVRTYRGSPPGSTATQSPVHTTFSGSRGTTNSVSARTVPPGVTTSHSPRSTRTTRPGSRPCAAYGVNSVSQPSSQPYGASGCEAEDASGEAVERDNGKPFTRAVPARAPTGRGEKEGQPETTEVT